MHFAARTTWIIALACAAAGCSSWRRIDSSEHWTLYAKSGDKLDTAALERALAPAFAAVESKLGPFEDRVRIHAWNYAEPDPDVPHLAEVGPMRIDEVPGIGKARVRAYHVTGGAMPFAPTGVFLGTADVGTVVHELVHARLAESIGQVPLWFEEGLASLWGDGVFHDGRWIVDGLACWPARVLREELLGDEELTRVMQLSASQTYSSRDNLLVHFVGWAVVFDLSRELPHADWTSWLARFHAGVERTSLLAETRKRIARSVGSPTIDDWIERLKHPEPGVRLAAAKGMWKLRSQAAVQALVAAIEEETDDQVRLALGLNALLAVGEMRVSRRTMRELWRKAVPALAELELEDPDERDSLREFLGGMRGRGGRTQAGLDGLSRYWEE